MDLRRADRRGAGRGDSVLSQPAWRAGGSGRRRAHLGTALQRGSFCCRMARPVRAGAVRLNMRVTDLELVAVAAAMALAAFIADDWIGAAAVLALWLCIKLVATDDRLFVLPAALTFHWNQTVLGIFYRGVTGREVQAHYASDYRPMVFIGLGCCLSLALGIKLGFLLRKSPPRQESQPLFAFGFGTLAMAYGASIFLESSLLALAPDYPSFRQIIATVDTGRLGILFLILRR